MHYILVALYARFEWYVIRWQRSIGTDHNAQYSKCGRFDEQDESIALFAFVVSDASVSFISAYFLSASGSAAGAGDTMKK